MTQLNLLRFQELNLIYRQTSNGSWFDEKDYFEFYPLHVLHKPKKNSRRRKITTNEGVYKINQDRKKILSVRPIQI